MSKGVLGYLDFLRPLLLQDDSLVRYAYGRFQSLAAKVREPDLPLKLESYEVPRSEAHCFFPSCGASVEAIMDMLAFEKHNDHRGSRIFLLDVLTVLVIICRGSLESKARFLFEWFNLSKSGMMSELEHSLLVMRIATTFHSIKAIGKIDVTEDDAKHIAFVARMRMKKGPRRNEASGETKGGETQRSTSSGLAGGVEEEKKTEEQREEEKENGKDGEERIGFLPGLDFDNFLIWARDSKESKVLVKFIKTLDRLVNTLLSLEARADAIGSVIEEKVRHKEYACSVPRLDVFPNIKPNQSQLLITYRSQTTVTLCLSSAYLRHDDKQVYIRLEKLKKVPHPFYEVPSTIKEIIKTNKSLLVPFCCERKYSLDSYQSCPLQRLRDGYPLLRVEIKQLDPSSRYVVTVYTPNWRFPQIEVTTLAQARQRQQQQQQQTVLSILPASLSLAEADSFVKSTPLIHESDAFVFTGTLYPIDQVIRSSLLFAEAGVRGAIPRNFAVAVAADADTRYCAHMEEQMKLLVGMCSSAAASVRLQELVAAHEKKQALYFNGMGPWGAPKQWEDVLGKHYFEALCQRLESVYAKHAAIVSPSKNSWKHGSVEVVFMCDPNVENFVRRQGFASNAPGISATELASWLVARKAEQDEARDIASLSAEASRLAEGEEEEEDKLMLLVRTPLDLMSPKKTWQVSIVPFDRDEEKFPLDSAPSSSSEAAAAAAAAAAVVDVEEVTIPVVTVTQEAVQPKLTGRHELIHGEYSSSAAGTKNTPSNRAATVRSQAPFVTSFSYSSSKDRVDDTKGKQTAAAAAGGGGGAADVPSRDVESDQFDAVFESLIASLFSWLRNEETSASSRMTSRRSVTVVSCGWALGANFEIADKRGNQIRFNCLLPTKMNPFEKSSGLYFDDADALLARIKTSLPEDLSLRMSSPSQLRALVVQGAENDLFLPINKIVDSEIDPVCAVDLPKVKILDGPRVVRLSADEVVLSATAIGYGRVRCTLYELPFEMDQTDAVSLIDAEEDKLRKIESIHRRCTKRRDMIFQFRNLLPYHTYCAAVEPRDNFPLVAHFRTLYLQTSTISSFIVAAVSESEYTLPSAGLGKISHLLEGIRPPAAPVHLIHHFSRIPRRELGLEKPFRSDVRKLYRHANVVHTLGEPYNPRGTDNKVMNGDSEGAWLKSAVYDDAYVPVSVTWSGRFCRMAPRDSTVRCLRKMIELVEKLPWWLPSIDNLCVFVQRPLLRYLQRQNNGTWSYDGPGRHEASVCADLFTSLLTWKSEGIGRDVQVICFAEVAEMKVVTVGYRSKIYYDQGLGDGLVGLAVEDYDDDSASMPYDLMSSSVAYSDRDDLNSLGEKSSVANEEQLAQDQLDMDDVHHEEEGGGGEGFVEGKQGAQVDGDAAGGAVPVIEGAMLEPPSSREGFAESKGEAAQEAMVAAQSPPPSREAGLEPGTEDPFGEVAVEEEQGVDGRSASRSNQQQEDDGLLPHVSLDEHGFIVYEDSALEFGTAADASAADTASKPASAGRGGEQEIGSGEGEGKSGGVEEGEAGGEGGVGEEEEFPPQESFLVERILIDDNADDVAPPMIESEFLAAEAFPQEEAQQQEQQEQQHEQQLNQEPTFVPAPCVHLRHIILPLYVGAEIYAENTIVFPSGPSLLDGRIELDVDLKPNLAAYNISPLPQRRNMYSHAINLNDERETAVYLFDVCIRELEGYSPDHGDEEDEARIGEGVAPSSTEVNRRRPNTRSGARYKRTKNAYHFLSPRNFISDLDFIELVAGPVIGTVTTNSAKMLFEINRSMRQLRIFVKPLGLGYDESKNLTIIKEDVQAFKVFGIKFEGLMEGLQYQIFLPDLYADKPLGFFRTDRTFVRYSEIVITGQDSFANLPMLEDIFAHLGSQQMVEPRYLNWLANYKYNSSVASPLFGMKSNSVPKDNAWSWLIEHFHRPCNLSTLTLQLGSKTMLTNFFPRLIDTLLHHGRRIFLPLRDASAVEAYYFNQFEEVVKDSFRLIWSIPVLREGFASFSNMPVFHSEYLVSTKSLASSAISTETDTKLIAVIRKVYETHFLTYFSNLYDWVPDMGHHARTWRSGSFVVILLDIVSGRKKLKKKKEEAAGGGGGGGEEKKEERKFKKDLKFSLGFLDKAQWKLIKSISEDESVTQIAICSQKAFLPLTDIPRLPIYPQELPKGEMLEWAPTVEDLEQFLMYWIQWLQPKKGRAILSKNVVMVGSSDFPYVTTIQDIATGSKIQQLCVGVLNSDDPIYSPPSPSSSMKQEQLFGDEERRLEEEGGEAEEIYDEEEDDARRIKVPKLEDLTLTGKIGPRLRYVHKFSEQDHVVVDCSREGVGGGKLDREVQLESIHRPNYGILSLCFDSWKAQAVWSIIFESEHIKKPPGDDDAVLIIGPILGPPSIVELLPEVHEGENIIQDVVKEKELRFQVGITIELDRHSTVTFSCENVFTNRTETWSFDVKPLRPYICIIGPLELESRFNVKITGGVRKSQCIPFVISTHMSWSESNFAFINCSMAEKELPNEDFTKDLLKRLKVPFSGITATAHLNSLPEFTDVIEELRRLPILSAGLAEGRKIGHLTAPFFNILDRVMERIRDVYRSHLSRPSYREVLRSSYTLFVQTHGLFGDDERYDKEPGNTETEDEDEDEDIYLEPVTGPVLLLLHLMITRVHQEYMDQVNRPSANVFRVYFPPRAINPDEDDAALKEKDLSPEELQRIFDEDVLKQDMIDDLSIDDISEQVSVHVQTTNRQAHPVKVVFQQWLRNMLPAPPKWEPWISPNGRATIEVCASIYKRNLPKIFTQFADASPIDCGVRIFIIDGGYDGLGVDSCFRAGSRVGAKLHKQASKWIMPRRTQGKRPDRGVSYVCPTHKYGTAKKLIETVEEVEDPHAYVYTVDSLYRSNEATRSARMLQVETELKAETAQVEKEGGVAKTKAAKAKRAEEERIRLEAAQKRIADVIASLVPDGYVFIEARTALIEAGGLSYGKSDVLSTVKGGVISSLTGGAEEEAAMYLDPTSNRPSPLDYIQIPEWLNKFFPSSDGIFVQDEVLLWMRQNAESRKILARIEDDEIVVKTIELYERSRLSELSRPVDLREVDMDQPGVVALFLKDLVERFWEQVVPADLKHHLVPVYDDFLRSFVLARALPDPDRQLRKAEAFARGMQYALVLSVALKLSLRMQFDERYKYIMRDPDAATLAVNHETAKDKKRQDAHDLAKLRDGDAYDPEAVDAELAKRREEDVKEQDGYESDLEALEEEEKEVLRQEQLAEEEEERLERLAELKEQEEEEAAELLEELEGAEEEGGGEDGEEDDNEEAAAAAESNSVKSPLSAKQKSEKGGEKEEPKKTKAEIAEEIEKHNKLAEIKAVGESVDAVLEDTFLAYVEVVALERIWQANLAEAMANRGAPPDAERLAEAELHMTRLAKERIVLRRKMGKGFTHLLD